MNPAKRVRLTADEDDDDEEEDDEWPSSVASASSSSYGCSSPDFTCDPDAALAQDAPDESAIDPETGDFIKPTPLEDDKQKAINMRRNIREVMDENQLDESTLAAQRLESERLARVQEQQRIIREVRRQIAMSRQDKAQARIMSLLQGRTGASVVKRPSSADSLSFPSDVTIKTPSGEEIRKSNLQDFTRLQFPGNLTPSVSIAPVSGSYRREPGEIDFPERKDVVEIVDSSSASSSEGEGEGEIEGEVEEEAPSSDSDDCIMLSDSELPPSPEAEDDPQNSGLHVNDTYNIPDEQGRVVINIGHPENEEDIFLAPQIGRIIKPHQIGGVRFLFDNIIESVERFSTSTGFGCILAHSMGLGKTLQVVCFCDIFLRHTDSKTVLCIMPINTLQNWVAEFNMWLPLDTSCPLSAHGDVRPRNFPIFVLNDSHKTLQARARVIKEWSEKGGVLMIGYELYRLLCLKKNKKPRGRKKKNETFSTPNKDKISDISKDNLDSDGKKIENDGSSFNPYFPDANVDKNKDVDLRDLYPEKKEQDDDTDAERKLLDEMHAALVKPGPDLVICDEGHRIKNSHSNISFALKQMRTKRRIVLTGYPLQNNLLEYWCMVDFVRPNYLGTKTEFSNMFERPIQNGQCIDSTPQDIRLMRYRAHVLHSLLVGFVQRRSHAVLQSTLPQKEEYVLLVKMTDLQRKLYNVFMNEVVRKKTVPNPLKAFAVCCKIWNHPDVLYYFLKKRNESAMVLDYDLEIEENTGITPNSSTIVSTPKKGKERKPRAPSKKKSLGNKADKNAKPAASVIPSTNSTNISNTNNTNFNVSKTDASNTMPQNYNNPNLYPTENNDKNASNSNQTSTYPPYPGFQQYPQNNYYGPNGGSFDPAYNNPGYYPNQNPYPEYNNYNLPNSTGNSSAPQTVSRYPDNGDFNSQGYWGSDNNYYNNQNPNYYPNQSQSNYPPNQNTYNPMYNNYSQPTQSYGFGENQTYNNVQNGNTNEQNFQNIPPETSNANYQSNNTSVESDQAFSSQPLTAKPTTDTYTESMYRGIQNDAIAPDVKSELPALCWPIVDDKKHVTESIQKLPALEIKNEHKTDSDSEVKIADLDTMKVIIDDKSKLLMDMPENKVEPNKDDVDQKNESIKKEEQLNMSNENKSENSEPFTKFNKEETLDQILDETKVRHKNGESVSAVRLDCENEKKEKEDVEKKTDKYEEVSYDWATEMLKNYIPGIINNSAKMEIFFCILEESICMGDRLLLFSQSLFTLNLIEDFLQKNVIPGTEQIWAKNRSYYRLDGSTSALEREKLINDFNVNSNIHLFLVSTRAGSLGINLVGANRVVVFDASWNPCHDTQAVCRVYRYGQQKPCFVYRFVMDNCLERKIYDRQINKQGMSDRVVDECNPDAVLSLKEVTNLCFDSDEKDTTHKDFTVECKDNYSDSIMKKIIEEHGKTLNKEPFQHESLLVDRKEKKLSSAEKRLAQRGYELEKKAAANPKPGMMYRTIRAADGTIVQRPVASVRPMQHGNITSTTRWIPAEVWQRQGMTAQEMTLPLDVVIPTNSADKSNIVLKAGQKVMVLKSPKGIYMQLESGKIIAIKTTFKVGQPKPMEIMKDPVNQPMKKVMPIRPPVPTTMSLPGSLKNNSAITVISKSARGGMQKVITRPPIIQKNITTPMRPLIAGPRIIDPKIRNINPNLQIRPYTMIRGRNPMIRGGRPIPIQNSVNIKIQSSQNQATVGTNVDFQDSNIEEEESNSDLDYDSKIDLTSYPVIAHDRLQNNIGNINNGDIKGVDRSINSPSGYASDGSSRRIGLPVPADVSEDSSQERTYADLSDKSESIMNVKQMNPKFQRPLNHSISSVFKGKTFLGNPSAEMEILNNVTIKRTSAESSTSDATMPPLRNKPFGAMHVPDESCSTEIMFSGYNIPSHSSDSDSNYTDSNMILKDKKIFRPNVIDHGMKPSNLKNYRHPKIPLKAGQLQYPEYGSEKLSPTSISSTPTPPPISLPSSSSNNINQKSNNPILIGDKFESSILQLERTTSSLVQNPIKGGMSDFQQSLTNITQTYPTSIDNNSKIDPLYKPGPKSRKKKSNSQQPIVESDASNLSTDKFKQPGNTGNLNVQNNITPAGGSQPTAYSQSAFSTGDIISNTGAFPESSSFHNPAVTNSNLPPQPFNTYPGFPGTANTYTPYPPSPYFQPYPPTSYPPYPQYPPYPPPAPFHSTPYPGYPPYPNPNHQW